MKREPEKPLMYVASLGNRVFFHVWSVAKPGRELVAEADSKEEIEIKLAVLGYRIGKELRDRGTSGCFDLKCFELEETR